MSWPGYADAYAGPAPPPDPVIDSHFNTPVFASTVITGGGNAQAAASAVGAALARNGRSGAAVAPSSATSPVSGDGRTEAEAT